MLQSHTLLREAANLWHSLAPMRRARARAKRFTYGDQLSERTIDPEGNITTEAEALRAEGLTPTVNNIIRQLVRSIVGRYRYTLDHPDTSPTPNVGSPLVAIAPSAPGASPAAPGHDLDARALEEFLISGVIAQQVTHRGLINLSPDRLICSPCTHSDASDATIIGALHDLHIHEILNLYATPSTAPQIRQALASTTAYTPIAPAASPALFGPGASPAGTCRIIDIWHQLPDLRWAHTVLTPSGHIIFHRNHPHGVRHPFFIKFYPYIDSEIHSLVDDVIDQQRNINRLLSMIDATISASAKGVLLYPADQLPDGFHWRDIRRIWQHPRGILPYRRTSRTSMPRQIAGSTTSITAASELLRTQLQLFDEISGVSRLTRSGASNAAGAEMLRQEIEHSNIAIYDILSTFREFTAARNPLLPQRTIKNE